MNYRKTFLILFVIFFLTKPDLGLSQTTASLTYYVSSGGSDSNNGTSTTTPWKTLAKVNQSVFKPGDNILFRRGDTFYGSLTMAQSGTSGHPIIFGAYGSGALPVITGFTNVTSWTNLGNNIWESTNAVSTLPTLNMVAVNGANTAMGRFPNTGYLTIQSAVGNTSITSSTLATGNNWKGAELVLRKNNYTLDRTTITNHTLGTGTLSYTDSITTDNATAGFGFFIQNDTRTLDAQNEWYYDPSTKKIRIFSKSSPTGVQAATVTNLLFDNGFDFITVDGINFSGANADAISFLGVTDHCTVRNSTISFAGNNGIETTGGNANTFDNNVIKDSVKAGIFILGTNGVITNNNISNSGVIAGQADNGGQGSGIFFTNDGALVQYNKLNNSGGHGIFATGSSWAVKNNFVDSSVSLVNDDGAIYTSGNRTSTTIDGNIVLNTIGNTDGVPGSPPSNLAEGIYLDEVGSTHATVTNNTVSGSGNSGIKIHKNSNNIIEGNTFYDNGHYQIYFQNEESVSRISGEAINNNIFFSRTAVQYVLGFVSITNDIASFGTAKNNYWVRPIDDNLAFITYQTNTNYVNRNLAGWQTFTGQDSNSHKSPKTITNVSDLRFEYNASSTPKTVTLDAVYIDVKNTLYPGTVTLAPWSSVVLIKTEGTVPPPADTIPPAVSLAVSLTGTVSGTINVSATATDNVGVTRVEFYKDNDAGPFVTDTSAAYNAALDTTKLPNGAHTLKAIAYDAANNRSTSQITITVANVIRDTTAPMISITSPTGGTVSGSITITADATDNVGVSLVEFYKDSDTSRFITDTTSPYSVSLDTKSLSNGTHTFKATAYDPAGNTKTSAVVSVTVNNNTADTTAPTVSITSPTGGTVSGTININADASDNVGVKIIEFYKDSDTGRFITDTTSPYSVLLDTTHLSNGTHIFKAIAYDAAGNSETSSVVSVTVNNPVPSDTIAPTVSMTAPASGRTIWGNTTISAGASDNVGVVKVQFYQGSTLIASETSSPYNFSWNTRSVPNGSYTLKAIAYDKAGNTNASPTVTVSIKNFRWHHR